MTRKLPLLSLSLLLCALPAAAAELGLEQALATAHEHQPSLRQARAAVDAARARAANARSGLLPQVSGSATYQRATANFVSRPGSLPSQISGSTTSESWTTSPYLNLGIQASQLVYDFGATSSRYHAAQASARAQVDSERAIQIGSDAAVRSAYFTARAARALVTVAIDTLANQEKHLQQIESFVEVGTRPEIDLAQAKADRANAQLQLIEARNGYETAKAQLNQAMGIEGSLDYDVADETMPAVAGEESGINALVAQSAATRPELASFAEQVRAQELTVAALRGAYYPSLQAATAYTDAGGKADSLVWNWNASLSLAVPLYFGGLRRAQVAEAEANLAGLKAQLDAERQQVRLEIEQARLGVTSAQATIASAVEALTNAQDRLALAEGRYEAGVGNIIELGDAQVALTAAAQQKVQADYRLATARAELLRALGR